MKWVRLREYNPRRGHLIRTFSCRGHKFSVDGGWYTVDDEFAEYLSRVRNIDTNPDSELAFYVCNTQGEATVIDDRNSTVPVKAPAEKPHHVHTVTTAGTMTTKDLPVNQPPRAPSVHTAYEPPPPVVPPVYNPPAVSPAYNPPPPPVAPKEETNLPIPDIVQPTPAQPPKKFRGRGRPRKNSL